MKNREEAEGEEEKRVEGEWRGSQRQERRMKRKRTLNLVTTPQVRDNFRHNSLNLRTPKRKRG
jgi:hypothetical protein